MDLRHLVRRHVVAAPLDEFKLADLSAPVGREDDEGDRRLAFFLILNSGHAHARDGGMPRQQSLDLGWEYAHSIDPQHLLAATEIMKVARLVDAADVAGMKPAILQRLARLLRLVPIALHQRGRAHADFAIGTE